MGPAALASLASILCYSAAHHRVALAGFVQLGSGLMATIASPTSPARQVRSCSLNRCMEWPRRPAHRPMITSAAGSTHFAFGATATLCSTHCECYQCLATASLAGSFLWAHWPACLESSCLHSQSPLSLLLHSKRDPASQLACNTTAKPRGPSSCTCPPTTPMAILCL